MNKFSELGLEEALLKSIEELGFENPTPIQESVIPQVLGNNADLVALAQTGTGKTAAFGLPLLQKVVADRMEIQVLVLSPTRELCLQICNDIERYSKYKKGIRTAAVYGGTDIRKQMKILQEGVHILVATPGRLCDLIRREAVMIDNVEYVILDEADEMLNMGFQEDLNFILEQTPEKHNTLLFSATMPDEVIRIAKKYLHDPVEITAGRKNQGADTVSHVYYQVRAKDCYETLRRLIDCEPDMYAIIFTRTKVDARDISRKLQKDGIDCDALHGDLSQAQRDEVMARFRLKLLKVLVATDVAARGLDVDNLTHVINYNLPEDVESYTHRSGRTGRAGKEGISVSIINSRERGKIRRLEKNLKRPFTQLKVPGGEEVCRAQLSNFASKVMAIEPRKEIEKYSEELFEKFISYDKETVIRKVFTFEFGLLLKKYKNAEDLNLPEEKDKKEKREHPDRHRNNYKVFSINVGKEHGFSPRSLMEIINYCAPKKGMDIGGISLLNQCTKFEIDVSGIKDFPRYFRGMMFEEVPLKVTPLEEEAVARRSKSKNRYSDRRKDGEDKRGAKHASQKTSRKKKDNENVRGFGLDRKFKESRSQK